MRNLRNRVSALALAVVMAVGMTTAFSAPVNAFDGSFGPPTSAEICAALDKAQDSVDLIQNAFLKALLTKLIEAAKTKYQCS